jgi:hypothetical protein
VRKFFQGTNQQGNAIRWRFTRITPGSFHWLGEAASPGTQQWRLQLEFHARRSGGASS